MLLHLPIDHTAEAVRDALTRTVLTLPAHLRRSLTWDQGAGSSGRRNTWPRRAPARWPSAAGEISLAIMTGGSSRTSKSMVAAWLRFKCRPVSGPCPNS